MTNKPTDTDADTPRYTNPWLWMFFLMYIGFARLGESESTTSSTTPDPLLLADSIAQCDSSSSRSYCVESYISRIQSERVRQCMVGNIDAKTTLASSMKNDTLSSAELKDLVGLEQECATYLRTASNDVPGSDYPIFSNFISSTAGSFIGNYLAYKVTQPSSTSSSSSSSSYRPSTSTSRSTSLSDTDQSYQKSTRNVQQMKSRSADTSSYSLGDSGKARATSSLRNSSSSTSRSSRSSSSSSSSSSKSTASSSSRSSGG